MSRRVNGLHRGTELDVVGSNRAGPLNHVGLANHAGPLNDDAARLSGLNIDHFEDRLGTERVGAGKKLLQVARAVVIRVGVRVNTGGAEDAQSPVGKGLTGHVGHQVYALDASAIGTAEGEGRGALESGVDAVDGGRPSVGGSGGGQFQGVGRGGEAGGAGNGAGLEGNAQDLESLVVDEHHSGRDGDWRRARSHAPDDA